jgi:hypothetical protein
MSEQNNNIPEQVDPVEQAIARRLARLRTRPVELASLQRQIEAQIPRPQRTSGSSFWMGRAFRAVAATFAVAITIAAITIASWSGPVLASTDDFVQIHQSMLAQQTTMTDVSSMEAANAALAGKWPEAPTMPNVPDHSVMSCCVHHVGKAKAACVLLSVDSVPVTMAAADASEMKIPAMDQVERYGVKFHVKTVDGLSMAMTQHDGKWYCLMGKLPTDRLISFWNGLKH